jgi:NO-binding membrane sensor protein with MHYT domain
MKNPALFYAAIVIGIVVLALGIYFQVGGAHPARAIAGLVVGAVLLVIGIVGLFMARSKTVAR